MSWEDLVIDEALRNTLKTLHDALRRGTTISGDDRRLLEQLSADLENVLAKPGAMTRAEHQSLTDRLQGVVTRFEVSHPDLTATIAQVTKALGDMGI